jgi:hypothetical protein
MNESTRDPKGWITTYSGGKFWPFVPRVGDVRIVDIAQGLGNLCRFTGQVTHYYSVSEHCIHVSRLVPERFALAGLLHDASEAYCNDVPSPLKHSGRMEEYVRAEEGVQRTILKAFGLPPSIPDCVHEVDYALCAAEAMELQRPAPEWAKARKAVRPERFHFYSPYVAGLAYMNRFDELTRP